MQPYVFPDEHIRKPPWPRDWLRACALPCSMFHVSSAPPWPRDWLRCVGPLHVPCVECTPWPRDWLRAWALTMFHVSSAPRGREIGCGA